MDSSSHLVSVPAPPDLSGDADQAAEGFDLLAEFGNCLRGGGLVDDLGLYPVDLLVVVVVVVEEGQVVLRQATDERVGHSPTLGDRIEFDQPVFETFAAAAQGSVDGVGGRGQPPLQGS